MVSRIIHQTWKGYETEEPYSSWVASWRSIPGWTHKLWNDDDNDYFVYSNRDKLPPKLWDVYKSVDAKIKRVDIARLVMLYIEGGVYVDLDFEAFSACGSILESILSDERNLDKAYLGLEPWSHGDRMRVPFIVCNAWMFSPRPFHPFWKLCLEEIVHKEADGNPVSATGPILMTRLLISRPDSEAVAKLFLFHPDVLYPIPLVLDSKHRTATCRHLDESSKRLLEAREPKSIAAHHWCSSWWSGGGGKGKYADPSKQKGNMK